MHARRIRVPSALLTLACLALVGGCGGDGGVAKKAPQPTAKPGPVEPTAGPDQIAALCSAMVGLDTAVLGLGPARSGGGSATPSPGASASPEFGAALNPALDRLEKAGAGEMTAPVATIASILRRAVKASDLALVAEEGSGGPDAQLDGWGLEHCGYHSVKADAVDYGFDGLSKTIGTGPTAVSLTNKGKETHEIVLFRVDDGVTTKAADLLALSADELAAKASRVAALVVAPGLTGTGWYDLKAGRYIAACFIPKGSVPPKHGDGRPHYKDGMVADLTADASATPGAASSASPSESASPG